MGTIHRIIRMMIILVFTLVFTDVSVCLSATYYVDYAGGADTYNGTSSATPFKHCPGDSDATANVASTTLAAGDIVYFKKGVSYKTILECGWSGSSVATGTNGTITSTGVLTDFDTPFGSVATGHYIYIYHSKPSITGTWVSSCGLWKIESKISNSQIILANYDGAAHETAEITYTIFNPIIYTIKNDWGTGDHAIFDAENTRYACFNIQGNDYLVVDGLKFQNTAYAGTLSYNWHAAVVSANSTLTAESACSYVVVQNCYFQDMAVNGFDTSWGDHLVLKNNEVLRAAFNGLGLHIGNYILYEGNTVTGPGCRSGIAAFSYGIVRNNSIKDMTTNWQGYHADGLNIYDGWGGNSYGWTYGNYIENCVQGLPFYAAGGGAHHHVVCNNVFYGRYTETGTGDSYIKVNGGSYLYIYNNTFYGSFYKPWHIQNGGGIPDHIYFKNNILYDTKTVAPGMIVYTAGTNIVFDNNHYYAPNYSTPFEYLGQRKAYSEWKTIGFDINSYNNITTDPLLTNPPNDFRLQVGSACIDSGIDLSAYFNFDKDGKLRLAGSDWDRGACEYGDSLVKPSPRSLRLAN